MIRITQFKLPIETTADQLEAALRKELGISPLHPLQFEIVRRSLDARRGHSFHFVYIIDVTLAKEEKIWQKNHRAHPHWQRLSQKPCYQLTAPLRLIGRRPIVVGLGPAGLFCALLLARQGLRPLIIERGKPVEKRRLDTQRFFTQRELDPNSNVQFGEGGAGTFSDGKLNTLVKDKSLRGRFVLEELVKAGAPAEILYDAKPHVGTDRLQQVVRTLREEILSLGGEIRFETQLVDLQLSETGAVSGAILSSAGQRTLEEADTIFLGIGHSARDTFAMLQASGADMAEKPFAIGLRIEHPRAIIDQAQYREYAGSPYLGAADYKLTHQTANGRGVYTFCMCPGGTVVAAASEPGTVVTNGMSNYARNEENSNSALLVTITPEDFASYRPSMGVLSGAGFQRDLERLAFRLGGSDYSAPIQCAGDFISRRDSLSLGNIQPSFTGRTRFANLWDLLPHDLAASLAEGIQAFGHKLSGFDRPDAILTGVESRSSSPVRILRDASMQSNLRGLYPMGEGAGYAGGIMSAAMDGMKAAEAYFTSLTPDPLAPSTAP
ncbi:MAG: hypothetical protein HFE64_06260 [Lachnospiraceae bacterium]|jgi:uncharacterized FAD-dependent dehydrogenase|nr:hypothetical protein [Lachnospiraceae bacterium]